MEFLFSGYVFDDSMEMEMERYHKGWLADWLVETGFILQLNDYRTIARFKR